MTYFVIYHSVWSVISTRKLTPAKREGKSCSTPWSHWYLRDNFGQERSWEQHRNNTDNLWIQLCNLCNYVYYVITYSLNQWRNPISCIRSFWHPFISVKWMQSSNFVHKCITDGYWLRIKNYAGIGRVSQNITSCEKFTFIYIMCYQMKTWNVFFVTLCPTDGPYCECHSEHFRVAVDLHLHRGTECSSCL